MELVCGVDEAGRGPLAGAVFAAAVILNPDHPINGLADSKKLSAKRRDQLAVAIREKSLAWSVASASVEEIDRLNILQASLLAMRRAIEGLSCVPVLVLVDGLHCPQVSMPARAIVKGDASEPAISAASILAKTARDSDMLLQHEQYPAYGFKQHMGYPTPLHMAALNRLGPCAIHRRSFAPVRKAENPVR